MTTATKQNEGTVDAVNICCTCNSRLDTDETARLDYSADTTTETSNDLTATKVYAAIFDKKEQVYRLFLEKYGGDKLIWKFPPCVVETVDGQALPPAKDYSDGNIFNGAKVFEGELKFEKDMILKTVEGTEYIVKGTVENPLDIYREDGAPFNCTTKTDETALIGEIVEVGKIFLVAADDPHDFNFCNDARHLFQKKCYQLKAEFYPTVYDYYKFKATMDGIKDALKEAPNGQYWEEIFFEDKDFE